MPMTFFADSSGAAGGAVPYQRTIDPNKLGMLLNLEQAELLRLQRYREHWRFYYNKHWAFAREDGDPLVTFNYAKKFIDKSAYFLVGKGFNISVPEPLVHATAPFLREVWKYNKRERLLWDMALMGGVTGDVFAMVTYREPSSLERRIFPHAQGRIVINLLGSEQVFPDWDPLNKDTMRSVRIETLFYDARPVDDIGADDRSSEGRQLNIRRYTQIITPDSITEHLQGEEPTVRPNILGEIPLVHIKNLPAPNEPYGLPDLLELIDVQREMNEKATDVSDIVNYHASPITVITGAKAKQLERSPRQIWSGLPKDASVFNLENRGDLGAAREYVDFVKEVMMDLSDTPEGSLGKMQTISNTAGVALHMQYQPLMEKTEKKRSQYGAGLEAINYYVLRIGQVMGLINLPFDIDRKSSGKIALVEVEPGVRERRAFCMNPHTLQFMDPMEMKLKFVRKYSFGDEIRESPYWRILLEHRGVSRSFWDPEPPTSLEDEEARKRDEENKQRDEDAKGTPAPAAAAPGVPPPKPAGVPKRLETRPDVPKLPPMQIDVPEEPEEVTYVVELWDSKTGEKVGERRVTRTLVPCGDEMPEYLNPYESTVQFNDPLPKDKHLQAQLFGQYRQMGLVSKRWCQEQIPEIAPDIELIARQLEREAAESGAKAPPPTEEQGKELDQAMGDSEGTGPGGPDKDAKKGAKERGNDTGRQ